MDDGKADFGVRSVHILLGNIAEAIGPTGCCDCHRITTAAFVMDLDEGRAFIVQYR